MFFDVLCISIFFANRLLPLLSSQLGPLKFISSSSKTKTVIADYGLGQGFGTRTGAGICWNTLGYFHVGTMWAPWHVPSSSLQIPHISGWGPWSCFATRAWQELREQGESKVSLCFFLGKLGFLQLVLRWLDIGQGERMWERGFLWFS